MTPRNRCPTRKRGGDAASFATSAGQRVFRRVFVSTEADRFRRTSRRTAASAVARSKAAGSMLSPGSSPSRSRRSSWAGSARICRSSASPHRPPQSSGGQAPHARKTTWNLQIVRCDDRLDGHAVAPAVAEIVLEVETVLRFRSDIVQRDGAFAAHIAGGSRDRARHRSRGRRGDGSCPIPCKPESHGEVAGARGARIRLRANEHARRRRRAYDWEHARASGDRALEPDVQSLAICADRLTATKASGCIGI